MTTAVKVAEPAVVAAGRGRSALRLSALGTGLALLVGVLGPNVVALDLRSGSDLLPLDGGAGGVAAWTVTAASAAALVLGGCGLWRALQALSTGWVPDAGRLALAGAAAAAAYCAVPPLGSSDILLYAAYGRIASTGGDPYTATAAALAASGDPVGSAAEGPWLATPSVYGPVETLRERLASAIGGSSVRLTVLVLALTSAVAYVVTGYLLLRLAGRDPVRRARVALLWSANPVLLVVVVGGGHNDTIPLALGVAALLLLRRSTLGSGLLLGAAGLAKLSLGLWGLAALWAVRGSRRAVLVLSASAATVLVVGYAAAGPHSLDQAHRAAGFVSTASVWRPLRAAVQHVLGEPAGLGPLVPALAWALAAVLVVVLARALPRPVVEAGPSSPPHRQREAAWAATVVSIAWLLTAPYTLAWYDALAWAPLALVGPSRVDRLLVVRTTGLALAYLPGRPVPLPPALHLLADVARTGLGPALGASLIGWAWVLARRSTSVSAA